MSLGGVSGATTSIFPVSETVTLARAREALRVVQVDPEKSVRIATAAARAAHDAGELDAASVAERALGLAAMYLQDLAAARRHLRSAMALAERGGAHELAAEARMTFAFAINLSGRPDQALTEIEIALRDLGPLGRARATAQRAAIRQQLGLLDQAFDDLQTALPPLRRAGDVVWVQRVLSNRALVHAFRQSYGPAIRDLHEAQRLCEQLGLRLPLAFVHENLMLVHRRLGDVPAALEQLATAESIYASLATPNASLLIERSELLLSVGLWHEARLAAEAAVEMFDRQGRRLGSAEALLLLARTVALDGDPVRAVCEGRRAVRLLGRQKRAYWMTQARYGLLVARFTADPAGVGLAELRAAADDAAAQGWGATALDLRLLAGRRGLAGRQRAAGRAQLEQVSAARHRGVATQRVKAWYATALLRQDAGDLRGADRAAARGLRILDDYRNTMAATELRAHVSGLGVSLVEIGLRHALAAGSAHGVLRWAELGRSRHLLVRPVRPPADPELSRLMAQLRTLLAAQAERLAAGRGIGGLLREQAGLEHTIRDQARRGGVVSVVAAAGELSVERLSEALGDAALVEYVHLGGTLHAVCVTDGRAELRPLGALADVRERIRWLPFALRRLAYRGTSAASAAAALRLLRRTAGELAAILVRPLADLLADRRVVLVPTSVLQGMPWSLLPMLAGRPVTVAPAATLWVDAIEREPVAGRAVSVAGPGLSGGRLEAERVAAIYGVDALLGDAASVARLTAELPGTAVLHLAAHGTVRADNPLFSSLRLADGPLTVYDLDQPEQVVDSVVLAACESGRDVVASSGEVLGLSAAFLAAGTRNVVASVVPIHDVATTELMVGLHRGLAAGSSVADALSAAQRAVDPADPHAVAAAMGFVCLGAGLTGVAPIGDRRTG